MGENGKGEAVIPDSNASQFADILQISMPTGDRGLNSVAIGAVDADGKFTPILVVNNDESVDINGILRVHGQIYGVTSDLPPLDRAKTLEKLIRRLRDASAAVREELVTAAAEAGEPAELLIGIVNSSKSHLVFEQFVGNAVRTLTAPVVFTNLDKDDDLRKLFVHEAMSTLHAQTVFDTLVKDDDLRKLFVHEAMSTLHAQTVFDTLVKDDDLRELFVMDAAASLSPFKFGRNIPIANQASIITEAFNTHPVESRDGFANSSAAARIEVWVKTWITNGLRLEMAQSIPDDTIVVANFAAELNGANPVAAKKLRDALIALIPLP